MRTSTSEVQKNRKFGIDVSNFIKRETKRNELNALNQLIIPVNHCIAQTWQQNCKIDFESNQTQNLKS